jgi:protocatechuate 3,4-dioxygenase beta subunit
MTALYDLLNLPTTQRLGWTLLHFIWQGALIAILCGLLLRLPFARNARAAYAVCIGGLLLCVLAPAVTFLCIAPTTTAPVGLAVETEAAIGEPRQAPTENLKISADAPDTKPAPIFIPAATDLAVKPVSVLDLPTEETTSPAWHERLFCTLAPYVPWLVVGWFPLALLLSLRLGWQWGLTRSWVHSGKAISLDATGISLAHLSERLGVRVRVRLLETARVVGPLTVGFLKPVILVPIGFIAGMSPAYIEAILLHELAHIRRWDYFVNLLSSVVTALLFYHPVVWWLQRRARLAREMCCDELAAARFGDRPGYALALAQLEVWQHRTPALAASDGSLLQRIRTLAGQRGLSGPSRRSLANLTAIFILTLGACLLLQSSPLADADESTDTHLPHKPAPSGQVIGVDGKPAAGAQVVLYHMRYYYGIENGIVETVETGPDGRFSFSNELIYDAWQSEQVNEAYYVFAWAPGQAAALAILKRDITETQDLHLTLSQPEPRTVHVTDKDGQPVAGANVYVHWWSIKGSGTAYFHPAFGPLLATADAQGIATFDQLPKAGITFEAEHSGYASNWTGCDSGSDVDSTICLRPGASIEGRVVDREGQPIPDVLVYASPTWSLIDYAFTRSDANGNFHLQGLYGKGDAWDDSGGTGEYRFGIEHPQYCAFSDLVNLKSGQTKNVGDLVTWEGTPVSGILLDPVTKQPIAGAQLRGNTAGGDLNLFTDPEGRFAFLAPPGDFYLSFWQPPVGCYVVEGYVDENLPHSINSEIETKPRELTLYAPSTLKKVIAASGHIHHADGTQAPKVRVVAELTAQAQIVSTRMRISQLGPVDTNAEGRFAFREYPEALPLRLIAWANNEIAVVELPAVHGADAQFPAITLQPALSQRVRLVDLDGQPLVKQRIIYGPTIDYERLDGSRSCPPVGYSLRRSAWTDEEGYATFKNIPDGSPCDFWIVEKPTSWKRILPDQMKDQVLPDYTLSTTLLVQLLDTDNQPLPVSRIETSEVGFAADAREYFHVKFSRENLSPRQQAEGWFEIPKEYLEFSGPDAAVALWIETPSGQRLPVKGIFPQFENTLVMRAEKPHLITETKVEPPFPLGPNETAYRVLDDNGQPLAGVSVSSNPDSDQHLTAVTDASGWCVLKGLDTRPYTRYAKFTAPGYAPQWVATIAPGEAYQLSMTKQTWLKGQFTGPDGAPVGTVRIRLKTQRDDTADKVNNSFVDNILTRAETDSEGRYDFPVSPGHYAIEAESEHGYTLQVDALDIEQGQTLSLPSAMGPGAQVEIILTDSQSGEPIEGMNVYVLEYTGPARMGIREGSTRTSDAEGRLHWDALPPRINRFDFSKKDTTGALLPYNRWWSKQHAWFPAKQAGYNQAPPRGWDGTDEMIFELVPGNQTFLVTVEQGIHVSGKVVLPEVLPADPSIIATIVPVKDERGSFSWDMRVDVHVDPETGIFDAWLPAGNGVLYRMMAYLARNDSGDYLPAALSAPFESRPGDAFNFELSMLGGGGLTGRVVNEAGEPIPGLKVVAIPTDHAGGIYEEPQAITDADGRFTMNPIRATEYGVVPRQFLYKEDINYHQHQKLGTVVEGETTNLGDIVFDAEVLANTQ